ncbi:MAG: LamG domain-containing protein [Planctomycetes bacterium]|nr:LamG domain-containing protein [Planctomycetota bacterium]
MKARAFKAGYDPSAVASADFIRQSQNPSLVAAYSFDEGTGTSVSDASSNGNGGSISGAAWTNLGKFGNALLFDGINDVVVVNDSNSLDLSAAMTLEAWVYPTAALSGWKCVLQKEVDTYFLHANSHTNKPAAGITTGGSVRYIMVGSALPANAWSHLAATYDGSRLRLYVNGVEKGSAAQAGGINPSSTPLRLGGNTYGDEFFPGRIDEVRIYNRALTAAEIQTDMNTPVVGN